jgi:hypothetical protein
MSQTKANNTKDGGLHLVRQDLVAASYSGASNLLFNELIKQWMVSDPCRQCDE